MAEFDLTMRLEDLPNRNKQLLQELLSNPNTKNKPAKEVASEFLGQFNSDFKSGLPEHLNFLTDVAFHKLSEEVFKEKPWPKVESFDEALNLHSHAKLLYKELYFRHLFSRIPASTADLALRCEAWNNYLELFRCLVPEQGTQLHHFELPCKWVWEILDEAIYQYQNFCHFVAKLPKDDPLLAEAKKRQDIPNFASFEASLKELIGRAQVLAEDGELRVVAKPKTAQYFGYYAHLALVKLYVSHGMTEKAFALLQAISNEYIAVCLKRSWCAMIAFFYYAGLTYILQNDILKGTKILEKCCSFFLRHKHFLNKSMQVDKYSKLVDRATQLLVIFLSFNKIETEDNIQRVITEKYPDKYKKLLKYDQLTFEETFTTGCCKITQPLMSADALEAFLALQAIDLVPSFLQKLVGQLNKYRILNGIESVLLIYSKLTTLKLSKILGLEAKQIEEFLAEYEAIRKASLRDSPFEQTFLRSILTHLKSHNFEVRNQEIVVNKVDESRTATDASIEDCLIINI